MSYLYLAVGIILGIVFLGMAKNISKRKVLPPEVNKKLKNAKHSDELDAWCKVETASDIVVGTGFILFGISATFMDSNILIGNILAIISLLLFVGGYVRRIINNKKHLNHFFAK